MNTELSTSDLKKKNGQNGRTVCTIFAERLALCRKKAKLTQQALADAVGVSKATIEKWEYGKREISLKSLVKVSEVLKVPTDYLLGMSDYDDTPQTKSINDRAKSILSHAQENGEDHSFLFETIFQQYIEQISIMEQLHESIEEHGAIITKVNVKGGENLIAHPAIKAYRALSALNNDTEKLLISMYKNPLRNIDKPDDFERFMWRC